MLRRTALVFATVAAVAVPTVGAASSAQEAPRRASQVVLDDAVDDVWTWSEGTQTWELWGTKADADAAGAVVDHGAKNVHVVMEFDNLRKKRPAAYLLRIKTKKMVRSAWVRTGPKIGWAGKHVLLKGSKKVASPGFAHEVDYTADTVSMVVPRKLVGDPAWIKVLVRNDLGGPRLFTDNPHTSGAQPVFTGKVHTS